ncbi:hypothetical protein M8818_000289 [Zalaria obscura]|uniref:Uncharacterized protein n=1 Tax=Zalaria obscura TaxID=2024903 RepID=A0ACC3SQJ9_9PEZI
MQPGSSAPPSSNPPTPRDVTSVQVAIDPGFGDPELSELPSSNSDSNGLANYVAYADALEKEADLNQITTAVPMGFVQRIKNLLEEKATADEAIGNKDPSPRQAPAVNVVEINQDGAVELPGSMPSQSVQDLVELPATPVAAPAELAGTPVKRITRDMITAITAPSESGTASEQNTAVINTNLDNGIEVQMSIKQTVEKADDSSSHYPSEHSTDSSPQSHNGRSSSPVETTTTVTMTNSSQLSGGDYAVHLEIPEFTASKMRQEVEPGPDELVLQNDHEREGEASTPDDTESEIADRSSTPLPTEPVSPLRSDENTDRNSVVSPMATKTPGQRSALEGVQQMPGAFPNQGDTPPTPRRKSKSVSFPLPPSADTTSRYSLPSDLNHSNEATGTTDFMTDVAVRFTVPPSASTGKPQVVQIRSSPESSTTNSTVTVRKDVYELPAFNSPRASYADKVPPLVIRKPESAVITTSTSNTESADLSCFIRRSFPRRQSVYFDDQPESKRSSRDSTTDLRFFSNHKYQSIGHLPGLKEESQEDMSTSDPDMRSSSFSFPLPRTLATKAGHERLRQSEDFSAAKRRSSKQPGMSLSEIHELPSLNFSRMDLIEKLNQALDIRSSVSLDVGRGRRFSGLYHPIPQRPASTEHLRERYTSFFVKPEEIEIPEPVDDEESSGQVTPEESAKEEEQKNPEEDGKATRPVSTMSKRPMSPEELLNVATEVSRLSIPSVTGLTERLSELLPSIKRLHLDSAIGDDEAVGHTIDEIHHLGERPETMMSVRSSGGLRLMAAAADKIVTNGTHDSTQMDAKVSRLMKELPPLPESADSVSEMSSAEPRNSSSSKQTRSPVSELEAPQPAFIRKSSVKEDSTAEALQPPPKLTSKRSLIISSPSSRPWNADESYPWSGTKLPVDLSFPEPAHHRNSITSDSVRSPVRVSLESTRYLDDTTRSRNVVSPGSVISDLEHATVTTEALTGHARKFSKRSIMGSITRKIGIGRDSPMLNRKRTTSRDMRSPLRSPDVLSLDDAVDPGDRYPTTALTSPTTALHLGETRSFFSDDSSEERREEAAAKRGSFRKHISHLKARLPPHLSPPTPPPRGSSLEQDGTRSLDFIGHGGASLNDSRITVQSVAVTYDAGVGMSKMEFRVKRVAERIKCLWARGGELLRSLSGRGGVGRSKVEREGDVQGMSRDEWLADSLYSGSAA